MAFSVDRRILVLALARMADAIANSFLIVVLPLYIASAAIAGNTFGLSEALLTGIILSMFGFLNSFAQPFTGRFSDRMGKRKVFVIVGLVILAVTNAAYPYVNTYLSMIVVRAIQGIGVAFTIPTTIALVNELSSTTTRGGSMGVFNTFRLMGYGAGPVVAGWLVGIGPFQLGGRTLSGFEAAFYVAALLAAISIVLVQIFVEDPPETQASAGEDLAVSIFASKPGKLFDPVFTLGLASLAMAIGIALISTIQPAVNAHLDQSPTMFGIEFGAFIAAQVILQTPVGRASDTYGRKPFVLWGLVLLVPATLAQGLVWTPWQMLIGRTVQGIAGAMVFSPALALAGDLARKGQSGTQLSVLTMAFGLGTAIGPLSSGALIQYGYVVPFAFGAVLAGVGALLVHTQVEETVGGPGSSSPDEPAASTD